MAIIKIYKLYKTYNSFKFLSSPILSGTVPTLL